jgi:hypothetical protein
MKIAPTHNGRGLRRLAGVALCVLTAASFIAPALAQRVAPEAPPIGGAGTGGGTGGGAGLIPEPRSLRSAPAMAPPPMAPAAPATTPSAVAPVAPAPIIRFRCEVPQGQNSCKEPPPADGSGGNEDECDCARDLCYNDGVGARICEKP